MHIVQLYSRRIADRYGIAPVIGSDAHTTIEIGRNYMEYNQKILNKDDFLKSIPYLKFHSCKCINISHKITAIVKVIKLIKKGEFHEIYRLIVKRIKKN